MRAVRGLVLHHGTTCSSLRESLGTPASPSGKDDRGGSGLATLPGQQATAFGIARDSAFVYSFEAPQISVTGGADPIASRLPSLSLSTFDYQ